MVWRPANRPDYDGPLLLDTHMWVWMLENDVERMSPKSVGLIERPAAYRQLYVSDISFWEVAEAEKGKLSLSLDPAIWLRRAESAPGLNYLAVDRTIMILSAQLEGDLRGDAGDRMLIASAQLHGIPVIPVTR